MEKCLNKECGGFDKNYEDNCDSTKTIFCRTRITTKPKKSKPNSYDFKVNHSELIDVNEICGSISRKNPLLFLETNDKIRVFVHHSVSTKAYILNLIILQPKKTEFKTNKKHLKAEWVEWVKIVKTAKWKEHKDVQKVKFIYPKI